MSRVLVISPHPDDESIGCGGTLRRHAVQGDSVRAIFLSSGEGGIPGRDPAEVARIREGEAAAATAVLGLQQIEFWHQRDVGLCPGRTLVRRLRSVLKDWRPDIVYVTHEREWHPDHRAAARLVRAAVVGPRSTCPPPLVLTFEVWTPLEQFERLVDISPYADVKLSAIRAYLSQCAIVRFDEAGLGLSRYRGEMHNWHRGGGYAEAFGKLTPAWWWQSTYDALYCDFRETLRKRRSLRRLVHLARRGLGLSRWQGEMRNW
jgi:LmbE family N-acetylglucosaminyl deacetylase